MTSLPLPGPSDLADMIHPMQFPAGYPRRILLAVTGLSPQIVTETLYALAAVPVGDTPAFIPTEIHLLTTTEGARLARAALLHPDGGQFHALLADHPQLGQPAFGDANIHLITAPNGAPLPDIRSPEENAHAADAITALVAELTRDDKAALHVSIAGGRKTMGFYLGYAFSLYARPQDRLSHVLVSSPFENHPEFFFPPAVPRRLATRDGRHIDTAEALVTLAEIPVVRLRHGLPEALLQGRAGFSHTVATLQTSLAPPCLSVNLDTREVRCGDRPVALAPALLAWFGWWARAARAGRAQQVWQDADAAAYLELYARVVGHDAMALEKTQVRLAHGIDKEFFEQNNSKLERALRDQLGPAAGPYLLARKGRRPRTSCGLDLPREAITLVI